jgi:hypothetical protein
MQKLVDAFAHRTEQAERALEETLVRGEEVAAKQRLLRRVADKYAAFAEDGRLDAAEAAELVASIRAAGLDASGVEALFVELEAADGAVRTGGPVDARMRALLGGAERALDEDQAQTLFWTTYYRDEANHAIQMASGLSQAEHRVQMEIIRNCKA